MNYDLVRQQYGNPENTVITAYETGDMPSSILTSKYEETDMGPDEDLYDDYARQTLTDQRPDKNKFEYEEARGGVNASKGLLQHHYYGHRGEADYEKPEIFLGFGGPEDHDPRGINTDPDMKQMVRQQDSRMRFVRWSPDGSDNITGGGRSESQLMADQQKLYRFTRDRLKVFSRQIDGRREGQRRTYDHKSNVNKQQLVQSYGDFIRDYALTPQRRGNFIAKSVISDSALWRSETADQDFEIARYTKLCRRARTKDTYKRVLGAQGSNDNTWTDADASKCYKAAGLLMSNIIRGKKQTTANMRESDMDFSKSQGAAHYKTAPFAKDLALILRAMVDDGKHGNSDTTIAYKTTAPRALEHIARQIVYNHLAPAHHYLNAEILYKSVKPGADISKIKKLVQTDANAPQIQDTLTTTGKSAKMQFVSGAKLDTADDTDKAESARTVNYKTLLASSEHRARLADGEDYKKESDKTQTRSTPHAEYRITTSDDVETGMKFLDNSSLERRTRGLGTKYTARFIDRDSRSDGITGNN